MFDYENDAAVRIGARQMLDIWSFMLEYADSTIYQDRVRYVTTWFGFGLILIIMLSLFNTIILDILQLLQPFCDEASWTCRGQVEH